MCKVIRFKSPCSHIVKLRISKCGGTYHKVRRNGRSVACTAEAYIDFKLPYDCGKCQQTTWDEPWKAKIDRAKTFLEELTETGHPGVDKISELVKTLEHEHDVKFWNVCKRLPLAEKTDVPKVKMGKKLHQPSPLTREVRPEDIVLDEKNGNCDATQGSESDVQFEAINYGHLLDNVGRSWVDDFLSQGDGTFPDDSGSTWPAENDGWSKNGPITIEEGHTSLATFGPDAGTKTSSGIKDLSGLKRQDDMQNNQIQNVINAFWKAVDDGKSGELTDQSAFTNVVQLRLQDLNIPNCASSSTSSDHRSENYTWTDGSCDFPSLGNTFATELSNPSSNIRTDHLGKPFDQNMSSVSQPRSEGQDYGETRHFCSKYDRMRADLSAIKHSQPALFNAKWLELSRWEIREKENAQNDSREIPAPVFEIGFRVDSMDGTRRGWR